MLPDRVTKLVHKSAFTAGQFRRLEAAPLITLEYLVMAARYRWELLVRGLRQQQRAAAVALAIRWPRLPPLGPELQVPRGSLAGSGSTRWPATAAGTRPLLPFAASGLQPTAPARATGSSKGSDTALAVVLSTGVLTLLALTMAAQPYSSRLWQQACTWLRG